MAQVTYRGIKYNTNDKKQTNSKKVQETYRGIKFEKEVVTAQYQFLIDLKEGYLHPLFYINYTKSYGSPSFKRHGINAKTSSIRTRS